jgi:hypothetical protein
VLRACLEKPGGWGSQDERHALTLNLCYCAGEMYVLLCKLGYCALCKCVAVPPAALCCWHGGAEGRSQSASAGREIVTQGGDVKRKERNGREDGWERPNSSRGAAAAVASGWCCAAAAAAANGYWLLRS